MKKTAPVYHRIDMGTLSINWILPGLALGVLILPAVIFGCTDTQFALANVVQKQVDIIKEGQTSVVPDEEENAYRAAKREPDPRKRAEKVYAFVQKYPKSALLQQTDWDEIKPIDEEYSAYYAFMQEPDFEKRSSMQIDFLRKFPTSPLSGNTENAYVQMLKDSAQAKKYELLESLSEKWLKLHPADKQAYAFLAEATLDLKKYQRCSECLEEIYKMQPSPELAKEIISVYRRADNLDKQVEWGDRIFKMPELADDYMLRYNYMMQFLNRGNLQKAAEYAQLTLRASDLVKPQDDNAKEQLKKMHRACHHIIGSEFLEKGDYPDAISAFREAVKDERYAGGYYMIGQCLDKQRDVEKATQYYAMAELIGGEDAPKAKARLESLYKALHNDTLVGIDKVYKKAKESLAESDNKL
jgi:tetratricopeptide (TPR) repeat protein